MNELGLPVGLRVALGVTRVGTSLDRAVFARVYPVNFQDYAVMNGVIPAPA